MTEKEKILNMTKAFVLMNDTLNRPLTWSEVYRLLTLEGLISINELRSFFVDESDVIRKEMGLAIDVADVSLITDKFIEKLLKHRFDDNYYYWITYSEAPTVANLNDDFIINVCVSRLVDRSVNRIRSLLGGIKNDLSEK